MSAAVAQCDPGLRVQTIEVAAVRVADDRCAFRSQVAMGYERDDLRAGGGGIVRHCIGACGVLAALALIGVSAAMNWRFGYSLGKTPLDGLIYGTMSAAADVLKAVVPFFFFGAVRRRQWSQAAAAVIVGMVVTCYSLLSAFGHAAQNRSETTGHRAFDAKAYRELGADLKRAQDQLSWVPPHRPSAVVAGEIDSMKIQRLWSASQECTAINAKAAREFCAKYHGLQSELGSGRQAEELEARIGAIQQKLETFQGTAAGQEADPQAALLAEVLGITVQRVQTALTMFVAILLEVGSGMGMYMALGQWRGSGPAPPALDQYEPLRRLAERPPASLPAPLSGPAPDAIASEADRDVQRFCDDRLGPAVGVNTPVTTVYDAYRDWCESGKITVMALPTFVRSLEDLGIRRVRSGDRLLCADVGIVPVKPPEDAVP